MKINNVEVNGIPGAIKASGYPMSIKIDRVLTDKDFDRANRLAGCDAGIGEDCFLKGVNVQADITAPQYWYLQFQRYHFADIVSSQSKMHRILKMDIDKQCSDKVSPIIKKEFKNHIEHYKRDAITFEELIASCPMGLMLTARITTNYLQLKSIYRQRRHHRLEEWQVFCDWIETLPYNKWIVGKSREEN
ncbi:hypothetical protein [Halocella sp. SP3-1]|uniref:hypothetical protein n=1 Tax=Halocella sp. SP3-1 TaxID=2382161 RepID=UPI000F75A807|nr:hypothetical protein [Halocella sp. SP3-1]AZO96154.1 hypothetical protein D7D81_17010 [Halocella sp. SP3-1]